MLVSRSLTWFQVKNRLVNHIRLLPAWPLTTPIIQSSSGQDKKNKTPKSDATSSKAPQKGKQKSKATPKKKEEITTAKKKADKGKQKKGKDLKGKGRA